MGHGIGARLAVLTGLLVVAAVALHPAPPTPGSTSPAAVGAVSDLLAAFFGALAVGCVVGAIRGARTMRRLPPGPAGTRRRPNVVRQIVTLSLGAVLLMSPAGSLLLHRVQDHFHPPERPVAAIDQRGKPSTGVEPAWRRGEGPLAAAAGAAAALLGLITVAALRRRRPSVPPVEPAPGGLGEAVAAGAAILADTAGRDPRERVIRCYAAMERVLAATGTARRPADTPAELLARARAGGRVPPAPAQALTELFRRARFSRSPIAEHDVAAARTWLAELRDADRAWREPALVDRAATSALPAENGLSG